MVSDQATIDYTKIIRKLSKKQREVFDRICVGDDRFVHPATGEALVKRGIVEVYDAIMSGFKDNLGPMRVKRYRAVLAAHVAWAALCDEECVDEA